MSVPGDRLGLDEGPETAADIDGPRGFQRVVGEDPPDQALAARVGRHEIPAPIDPDTTFVAQDGGPLLVKLLKGAFGDHDDLGIYWPRNHLGHRSQAGLVLVVAERRP